MQAIRVGMLFTIYHDYDYCTRLLFVKNGQTMLMYLSVHSALASCVALGLRSRLDSTDYIHVIVPRPLFQTRLYLLRPWSRPASMQSSAYLTIFVSISLRSLRRK